MTEDAVPGTRTEVCGDIIPGGQPAPWHIQVQWCPAWDRYLCADCRARRSVAELRTALAGKPVPRVLPPDPLLTL